MQAYAKLRSWEVLQSVGLSYSFIYVFVYLFFIMEFTEKSGKITVEVEKKDFSSHFYYATPTATFEFLIPAQIEPINMFNWKDKYFESYWAHRLL